MHVFEKNIKDLGYSIPELPVAIANYVPFKIIDNLIFISGQAPSKEGVIQYKGKVDKDISIEDGIKAAELCCMNIIACLKRAINQDWDKLDSFVKLGGFVNCLENFTDHPKIINAGDTVWISPNEEHWHGATPTNSMTHIAIQESMNGSVANWLEKVADAEYNSLYLSLQK